MNKVSLDDNEKTLVLSCYPEEAAHSYYVRMTVKGLCIDIWQARKCVEDYIETLNLPSPDHSYLKAAPIVGLKSWNK